MSPSLDPINPVPSNWAEKALLFLESYGFLPRTPAIRASDLRMCPRLYLIRRRFSVGSIHIPSKALNRGTWGHHIASIDPVMSPTFSGQDIPAFPTPADTDAFEARLEARLAEVEALHTALGSTPDQKAKGALRERKDAYAALAWYAALSRIPFVEPRSGSSLPSLRHWVHLPNFTVLGTEVECEIPGPRNTSLVCMFDVLLYNQASQTLYILDYKFTSHSPKYRLSFCPCEFQTTLYLDIARQALSFGLLHKRFPVLSPRTQLGGMYHIAIYTPSLQFGLEDRPFTTVTRPLKSGPRKGQLTTQNIYEGDPSPPLYFKRIAENMLGIDRYADLAPARAADPSVNASFTPISTLDTPYGDQYHARLSRLALMATRPAYPRDFLPDDSIPQFEGDPFVPFLLTSPYDWPGVLASNPLLTIQDAASSDRRAVRTTP